LGRRASEDRLPRSAWEPGENVKREECCMRGIPGRRTWVALGGLAVLLGAGRAAPEPPAGRSWPMFGGTPSRNMANTVEKNIADTWSMKKGKEVNVKWVARLGNNSYAAPVVAGGRVFVGTNNAVPRDPAIKGDKGVLMCFRESDGAFLWQAVHDKLPDPEQDGPHLG